MLICDSEFSKSVVLLYWYNLPSIGQTEHVKLLLSILKKKKTEQKIESKQWDIHFILTPFSKQTNKHFTVKPNE